MWKIKKSCELRKRATLLISANSLALVILHSRLAVAILTFTMWSSCPVNCECINCNLYFDVCCYPPTPTQKIKTWKIAAKFFNMLSSPSLSADVDLVSSSTNLHAPSTKTLPVSLATDVDWPRSRGRGIIRAMNAHIEPPWIFKSDRFVIPTWTETDPTSPGESPSPVVLPSLVVSPSPVELPSPVVSPSLIVSPPPAMLPSPVVVPVPVIRP